MPWQVEDNDGNVISDRAAILSRWQCDFSSLLNHVQDELPHHLTLAADINNEHAIDTGMQNPITYILLYYMLGTEKLLVSMVFPLKRYVTRLQ